MGQPAWLEIAIKMARANIELSKKSLILFAVCLFVCSFESFKNIGLPPEKKEGNSGPDPLVVSLRRTERRNPVSTLPRKADIRVILKPELRPANQQNQEA